MSLVRAALAAIVLLHASLLPAAEPARRWRPVVDAEGRAVAAPSVGVLAPAARGSSSGAGLEAPSWRVHIDPVSGEIVPAPPGFDPASESGGASRRPAPDFTLRRTPEGFLYLDTRNYRITSSARIDADGRIVMQCGEHPGAEADHVHPPALRPGPERAP
jgi:hypothetical protein